MTAILMVLFMVVAVLFITLVLTVINILQRGYWKWNGKTIQEILGVSPDKAGGKDIDKLPKHLVMQLFYASPAPELGSMNGEYKARGLSVGSQAYVADFITNHFFGPGRWQGKAFYPFDKEKGSGYNIFKKNDKDGNPIISRTRRMNTHIGISVYDDRNSFRVDYSLYNGDLLVHSMRDEIRKINDKLYIGMGYMALGGGSVNPAPFILYGEPEKWVGPDT